MLRFRREFDAYTRENQSKLNGMIPRERRKIYASDAICAALGVSDRFHPLILDAVEGVIGPNIMVWEASGS